MLLYITRLIAFTLNKSALITFNLNVKKTDATSLNLKLNKEMNFTLYRER